jgi:hypothetical protein
LQPSTICCILFAGDSDVWIHGCVDGSIFEERPFYFAGDPNTEYDSADHAMVYVLGYFEEVDPNEKQLQAVNVFNCLCKKHEIAPDKVRGRGDPGRETVYPGKDLQRYLLNGYILIEVRKGLG